MTIGIGTTVEWDSQTQGNRDFKAGTVVHILSEADTETPREIAGRLFPNHIVKFKGDIIPRKAKTAYLVEVLHGRNRKPQIYLPWPIWLREVLA